MKQLCTRGRLRYMCNGQVRVSPARTEDQVGTCEGLGRVRLLCRGPSWTDMYQLHSGRSTRSSSLQLQSYVIIIIIIILPSVDIFPREFKNYYYLYPRYLGSRGIW